MNGNFNAFDPELNKNKTLQNWLILSLKSKSNHNSGYELLFHFTF